MVGCAQTRIASRPDDACGEFSSTSADQYAMYRGACAQGETVRALAEMRRASVEAATQAVATIRQREVERWGAPETIAETIVQFIDAHGGTKRPRIAVFSPTCGATPGECATVRSRIESALVRSANVTVLEHTRAEDITHELVLQQSDRYDDASIARLGRTLGATHVVLIEVTALPHRVERLRHINARCITAETGRIIAATDAEFTP